MYLEYRINLNINILENDLTLSHFLFFLGEHTTYVRKDLLKHGELRNTYTTFLGIRKRQIFALLMMAVSCQFDNLQATKKYTLHYLCSSLDGQISAYSVPERTSRLSFRSTLCFADNFPLKSL